MRADGVAISPISYVSVSAERDGICVRLHHIWDFQRDGDTQTQPQWNFPGIYKLDWNGHVADTMPGYDIMTRPRGSESIALGFYLVCDKVHVSLSDSR